jgi:hypothetical protein
MTTECDRCHPLLKQDNPLKNSRW